MLTITATKNGAQATIIPTFEAYVMESAVFSSIKYKTIPNSPAPINATSCFGFFSFNGCGETRNSIRNASTARVNNTSEGINCSNNTFVDTKVAPHMICVPQAITCPKILCFSLVIPIFSYCSALFTIRMESEPVVSPHLFPPA